MNNLHTALRRQMLERLDVLTDRKERIDDHLSPEEPVQQDFADQATEREHDEVVEALGVAGTEQITRIRSALERMDAGTYGVCIHCGDAIGDRRLQALPYTELCVTCAADASSS